MTTSTTPPTGARPVYLTLEVAKQRLGERIGLCRASLHNLGYADELRRRGLYLGRQRTLDGDVRFRCFRVPAEAVAEVAALAERGGPLPG